MKKLKSKTQRDFQAVSDQPIKVSTVKIDTTTYRSDVFGGVRVVD